MKHLKNFEAKKRKYTIDDVIDLISHYNYDEKKIKEIMDSGVNINSYNTCKYPAIHMAAYISSITGNLNIMDSLIAYGAKIDAINTQYGDTTLISTVKDYNTKDEPYILNVIYYLIDHGADWNKKSYEGVDFIDLIHMNRSKNNNKELILNSIIDKYPEKYKDYLIRKEAEEKYNL